MAIQWTPGSDNLAASITMLGKALMPDPAREAQAAYAVTHAADLRQQMDARLGLSRAVAAGAPPESIMAAIAAMGPAALGSAGAFSRANYAAAPGTTANDPRLGVLQMGAGQGYNDTYAGTQETLANAITRAHISAGPGHASVAEQRRQFDNHPETVMINNQPVAVRRADVVAGNLPPGTIMPISRTNAEGNMAIRVANGQATPAEAANAFSWLKGAAGGQPRMALQVGHTDTKAMSDALIAALPGLDASDPVTTTNRLGLVGMATQAFQQGGNMADAVRQTAQWAREHGATQGRSLLWGQGDYSFENMASPPAAADQGNVRIPVGPGGLPYIPSNMAQVLTGGATGLPPAARDNGGANGSGTGGNPSNVAAGIGQPERAGGGWSQVPEGSVVTQGGKRFRKVNGQAVPVGN